jgi:VIT1/CCC1 family predicted Fe2+/Mn2+ transporter
VVLIRRLHSAWHRSSCGTPRLPWKRTHAKGWASPGVPRIAGPRCRCIVLAFALGALIPLVPWFFSSGLVAGSASILLAGVATLGTGATIARLAERPLVRGAVRQLAVSIAAAAVTYTVAAFAGERIAG